MPVSRDDFVLTAPRVGYISNSYKACALLWSLTAPDAAFRNVARQQYYQAPFSVPVKDTSAWDVLTMFTDAEWKEAWEGCCSADELSLLFERKNSFRLHFNPRAPRREYICTHLKPYALLYALTCLGNEEKTIIWTRMYNAANAREPILAANRDIAREEIMQLNDSFWIRRAWEACITEEHLGLLFEKKTPQIGS